MAAPPDLLFFSCFLPHFYRDVMPQSSRRLKPKIIQTSDDVPTQRGIEGAREEEQVVAVVDHAVCRERREGGREGGRRGERGGSMDDVRPERDLIEPYRAN